VVARLLFLAEQDWSNDPSGILPTPATVEQMLQGTTRQLQDVLIVMEPCLGLATLGKLAINTVMASCCHSSARLHCAPAGVTAPSRARVHIPS